MKWVRLKRMHVGVSICQFVPKTVKTIEVHPCSFSILRFDRHEIEEGALYSTMSVVSACTVTFWQIIPFMGLTNFSDLKALMCSQNI